LDFVITGDTCRIYCVVLRQSAESTCNASFHNRVYSIYSSCCCCCCGRLLARAVGFRALTDAICAKRSSHPHLIASVSARRASSVSRWRRVLRASLSIPSRRPSLARTCVQGIESVGPFLVRRRRSSVTSVGWPWFCRRLVQSITVGRS
jgi:hypothetical protein